jgi:hypothetical protein
MIAELLTAISLLPGPAQVFEDGLQPVLVQSKRCDAALRIFQNPIADPYDKQFALEAMRSNGCFGLGSRQAPAAQPSPAPPSVFRDNPQTMIRLWHEANGQCRGGAGNEQSTHDACEEREVYGKRLDRLGWCYGKENEFGYQMSWHRCSAGSTRPQVPSRNAW